jgi:ATP-dependent RNA helicase MSS116
MFNASRRGPASLSRVLRAASNSFQSPSARRSIFAVSRQYTRIEPIGIRQLHVSPQSRNFAAAARVESEEIQSEETIGEIKRFDELIDQKLVHPNVVQAITKGMGHQDMTVVQAMTIRQALQKTDM